MLNTRFCSCAKKQCKGPAHADGKCQANRRGPTASQVSKDNLGSVCQMLLQHIPSQRFVDRGGRCIPRWADKYVLQALL